MGADEGLANSLKAHRKYLLRYALFQLRDASLAEDAVQDTLVAALAQGEGFAGRSQLLTWLTSILKHKVIDLVRKRGRGLPRRRSERGCPAVRLNDQLSIVTMCAWILPSTAPCPNRLPIAFAAMSVASPSREASRASISFLSGVP